MTRPDFPAVIDSSLLSAFRSCPGKCFLEYFQHWKTRAPNIHLHAGKAYASGLEAARRAFYEQGHSEETAIAQGLAVLLSEYGDFECPPDSAKSLERTAGAFEYYFTQYPMATDSFIPHALPSGGRGIEFSFSEPIDLAHPQTSDPILFCGRFDALGDYAGGLFGLDDKTTSSLGASWPRQWDLRSQFTAYAWGAARGGMPLQGFLVRGLSILKIKYDTLQAITYRPQWMIERWYEQTLRDIQRMIQMWDSGVWDYSLDNACNEYGGCVFRQPCMSLDPQPWLEGSFTRRRWDPVLRIETEL